MKVGTKRCLEGLCLDVSESGNQAVSEGPRLDVKVGTKWCLEGPCLDVKVGTKRCLEGPCIDVKVGTILAPILRAGLSFLLQGIHGTTSR